MRHAREQASKNKVKLHVHLAETEYELNSIRGKHGLTPTAYLEQLGFWGSDTWAAHSIWLEDADIDILKKYGVGVAHNPQVQHEKLPTERHQSSACSKRA